MYERKAPHQVVYAPRNLRSHGSRRERSHAPKLHTPGAKLKLKRISERSGTRSSGRDSLLVGSQYVTGHKDQALTPVRLQGSFKSRACNPFSAREGEQSETSSSSDGNRGSGEGRSNFALRRRHEVSQGGPPNVISAVITDVIYTDAKRVAPLYYTCC